MSLMDDGYRPSLPPSIRVEVQVPGGEMILTLDEPTNDQVRMVTELFAALVRRERPVEDDGGRL